VDILRTARDDVRGIVRLGAALLRGRMPLTEARARLGRTTDTGASGPPGSQIALFAVVGVLSTMAYAGLYLLLRGVLSPFPANAVALVVTAVANTAANRRVTFGVRGRSGALRQQVQGLAIFTVGLTLTSGSLWLLQVATASPAKVVEMLVLSAANLFVTVMRFLGMRLWVFADRPALSDGPFT
jgi:putative flippase GtrA